MSVPDSHTAGGRTHGLLAGAALMLALGAVMFSTSPDAGIAPIDLAERIRGREAGLVILDTRGEDFDAALAVPGAQPVEPGGAESWPLVNADHIVVYDLDEPTSRLAAAAARDAGRADAIHLEGGLAGWVGQVLEPVLPPPVTPLDSATNHRIAELSRYFGGRPRVGADTAGATAAERVRNARRRGCGPGR